MQRHKFRVGQLVRLDAAFREHRSTPGRTYKILRLLPPEGSECIYSIKTIREAVHRIAMEREIVALP